MGEYEDFVGKIPKPERVTEPLQAIDNRLDFLGPMIVEMRTRVANIETLLGIEPPAGGGVAALDIEQIPFSYNLAVAGAVGSKVTLTEKSPYSGYIRQVVVHWPDGCDGLVDIRIGHGTKQFCPKGGYLALNAATPSYRFNERVEYGEEIWVEMLNHDGGNTHNVNCTVFVEEAG